MRRMAEIVITEAEDGKRLDAAIAGARGLSRAAAAAACDAGGVTVDGTARPKAYRVRAGERVDVVEVAAAGRTGELPELSIAWEDNDVVVLDKPAGVVVHPASGVKDQTLVDALIASARPLSHSDEDRPGI